MSVGLLCGGKDGNGHVMLLDNDRRLFVYEFPTAAHGALSHLALKSLQMDRKQLVFLHSG